MFCGRVLEKVGNVNISVLEMQRARKMLEALCTRRNSFAAHPDRKLRCCQESGELFIGDSDPFRSIVKLRHEAGGWRVFVRMESGGWNVYPHLPYADDLQAVIDELEQAPLHVHW